MLMEDSEDSSSNSLGLDLHEIDAKLDSEIPEEIKYQISNILSLVKAAIEKLKISLILPKIVENPKILQEFVKNTKYEKCLKIIKEYRHKDDIESFQELNKIDFQTIKIIDYFQENYEILNVLPTWLDDITNTEKYLLTAFEDVYQIAQQRFQRTATSDLTKEKRLHEIYLANEDIKQQLGQLSKEIQARNTSRSWKLFDKSGELKVLEDQLAFIKFDNKVFVEREMNASKWEVQQINNELTVKQQELEEVLKKARLNYNTQLEKDLSKEKSITDERNKLQIQLGSLIKKYDQTIFEKYAEELLLQEEYEKQKQEFNNFLLEFKREEDIYEELVCKKEREFQELHDAKVLLFIQNRAAKKIQKWWKTLLKIAKAKAKAKNKAKGKGNKEKPAGNKKDEPSDNKKEGKGKKKK